ncbi:uncharacterized protein [Amphiura filiformis]|uniref:uncharacterized protein n=1 Tax=Amphiura filiformis TaxID=82378 RepID=UPI003B224B39
MSLPNVVWVCEEGGRYDNRRVTSSDDAEVTNTVRQKERARTSLKYLIIYMKISILMGFTWIFGYIATFTGIDALWFVFIILNSSRGFFVFLANTCNRRVYRCYRQALCGRGNRVKPQMALELPQQHYLQPQYPIENDGKSLIAEAIKEGQEGARIKEVKYEDAHKPIGYDPDKLPSSSRARPSLGYMFSQNLCERSLVIPVGNAKRGQSVL